MPPHSTAKADTAVALVLGGMSVQSAWEQSGQPGKTRLTGQDNIRKRVKRAREAEVAAPLLKAAERGKMVYKKCKHGRARSRCKDCGGSGVCEHGRRRNDCKECGGASICEHGRRRGYCKECGVWSYESTSMEDLVGYSCGVCKVRECVCQPRGAELTRPPAGPGSTRGRASLDPRVARVRHSL